MTTVTYEWVCSGPSWVAIDESKIIRAEIMKNGERTHIHADSIGFGTVQMLGTVEEAKSLIEEYLEGHAVFEQILEVTGE